MPRRFGTFVRDLLAGMRLGPKLTVAFLVVAGLPLLLAAILSITFFFRSRLAEARSGLSDKLEIAGLIFDKKGESIAKAARSLSEDGAILINTQLGLYQAVGEQLRSSIRSEGLTFADILDPDGRVLASGEAEIRSGGADPVVSGAVLMEADLAGSVSRVYRFPSGEFTRAAGMRAAYEEGALALVGLSPIFTDEGKALGYALAGLALDEGSLIAEMANRISDPVLFLDQYRPLSYSEGAPAPGDIEFPRYFTPGFLDTKNEEMIDVRIAGKSFVFGFVPFDRDVGINQGYAGVGFPKARLYRESLGATVIFAALAIFVFALAGLIADFLSRSITKPILAIVDATKSVVAGNFNVDIPVVLKDEVGVLAQEFKIMTEKLKSSLTELREEILERKEAEENLRRTRNYLKNVFNSLPSMLVTVDREGTITEWNSAAERQTGIAADQAVSKPIWDLVPLMEDHQENIRRVVETRKPAEYRRESVGDSGKRHVNVSIFPLVHNGVAGAVIRLDDVTELEEKNEQLKQAQKMETIGMLAGGLAHDFNNVLGAITGSVSLLRLDAASPDYDRDAFMERLDIIGEATNRAADTVRQLLALSSRQEISFRVVDLVEVMGNVVKICRSSFDKSVEILTSSDFPKANIRADFTQIEQVLLNLCINAAHAMTIMREEGEIPGGKLRLRVSRSAADQYFGAAHPLAPVRDYWIVEVRDTGVGIAKDDLKKIFDPFFTTKQTAKGTGLGLTIAYSIIHQHHGFIDVYSEPNLGSCFRVCFPVYEGPEDEKFVREEKAVRGSGLILIVDDEEMIRRTAGGMLKSCGYRVIEAADGREAVELFRERHAEIAAVLLDVIMPVMSGKETFLEMKRIDPGVKVLLDTGFANDKRVEETMALGAKALIQKPYSLIQLSEKIGQVIASE